MSIAIKIENLSKRYRLGVINRDMLYKDLQSRWAKLRGKQDPNAPIGFTHDKRLERGDEFWALRNIDLEVNEGEILGIIGRNGAGKSTLLKVLSQITAPTEGRIKVKGRIASLLEVGTGFHPELTGRENAFLNGAILGMTRKEVRSKFDEIVAFAEIEQFIDTPVKRYSSGMYVRLAFAVAAHLEPEILIVDEVLAVGDAAFQKKCLGKMKEVSVGQGRTVIFVSHNMASVQALCGSGVVLSEGSVFKAKSPVEDAAEAYVRSASMLAEQQLFARTDRHGEGKIRLKNLKILDRHGSERDFFLSGQAVSFQCRYSCQPGPEFDGIEFGLAIYHIKKGFVTYLSNVLSQGASDNIRGDGDIICTLDRLPLTEGTYFINAVIKQRGTDQDRVQEAKFMRVMEGDYFGTGRSIPKKLGGVFIDHRWSTC